MKKFFSLAVSLIIAIGIFSIPVCADGGDFLLRVNKWGISSSEIKETGTYICKTNEYDSQNHTWTSENYSAQINGDSYKVRYDFNDKDHLFGVAYFTNSGKTDNKTLSECVERMYLKLVTQYGEPETKPGNFNDTYVSAQWESDTAEIILFKIDGGYVQVFYTIKNFDWNTMDLAAGESVVQYSVPLE